VRFAGARQGHGAGHDVVVVHLHQVTVLGPRGEARGMDAQQEDERR
jgi:hypothetical protein